MPLCAGKFYTTSGRNPQKLRRRSMPYRIYGENFRIVYWNVPLITYWNRVPIYLRAAWHNNTVKRRKKNGTHKK